MSESAEPELPEMAWIKLQQSVATHNKILELAAQLQVSRAEAVGIASLLWLWSLDNSAGGVLLASPATLAFVTDYRGDPNRLTEALIRVGLLDLSDEGAIEIHGWQEHMGRLLDRREANARQMRESRAKRQEAPPSNVRPLSAVARGVHVSNTCTPREEKSRVEQSRTEQTAPASPSQKRAARVPAAGAKAGRADKAEPEDAPAPPELRAFAARLRPLPGFRPTADFWEDVQRLYGHLDLLHEATKMVTWWREKGQARGRKGTTTFVLAWLERAAERTPSTVVPFRGKACEINPQHAAHKPWEVCPDDREAQAALAESVTL